MKKNEEIIQDTITQSNMNTAQLLSALDAHSGKSLIFVGPDGRRIPSDYHITEVKSLTIESVDCGGRSSSDAQTVTQLWSPAGDDSTKPLTVDKALKIMKRVDNVRALNRDAEALFEWGDSELRTAVCYVADAEVSGSELRLTLGVRQPVCKPALEMAGDGAPCCGPGAVSVAERASIAEPGRKASSSCC